MVEEHVYVEPPRDANGVELRIGDLVTHREAPLFVPTEGIAQFWTGVQPVRVTGFAGSLALLDLPQPMKIVGKKKPVPMPYSRGYLPALLVIHPW